MAIITHGSNIPRKIRTVVKRVVKLAVSNQLWAKVVVSCQGEKMVEEGDE